MFLFEQVVLNLKGEVYDTHQNLCNKVDKA